MVSYKIKIIHFITNVESILGAHRFYDKYRGRYEGFLMITHGLLTTIAMVIAFHVLQTFNNDEYNFVWTCSNFAQCCLPVTNLVFAQYYSSASIKLLSNLQRLDSMIKYNNIKGYHDYYRHSLIIPWILLLTFLLLDLFTRSDTFILFMWYFSISSWLLQIILISTVYRIISDIIEELKFKLVTNENEGSTLHNMETKIEELWIIYCEIIYCCNESNKIFGVPVMYLQIYIKYIEVMCSISVMCSRSYYEINILHAICIFIVP